MILGTSLESPDIVEAGDEEDDDILEEDETGDDARCGDVKPSSPLFTLINHINNTFVTNHLGQFQDQLGLLSRPFGPLAS